MGRALMLVLCIFLASCGDRGFESEARRLSETVYFTVLEQPAWIEKGLFQKVELNKEFHSDSLRNDLEYLKSQGTCGIVLSGVQSGLWDTLQNGTDVFVLKSLLNCDTVNCNESSLVSLIHEANRAGIRVILDWHYNWTQTEIDDSLYMLETTNWNNRFNRVNESDENQKKLIQQGLYWTRTLGFNGLLVNSTNRLQVGFWEEFRDSIQFENETLMITDSENPDLLNKAFNVLCKDLVPNIHLTDIAKNNSYIDQRSWYQDSSEDEINHFLQSTYLALLHEDSWLYSYTKPTDSLLRDSLSQHISFINGWRKGFMPDDEFKSTTDQVYSEEGLTCVERTFSTKGILGVLNYTDSVATFKRLSPRLYRELYSDSTVNAHFKLQPKEFRILYYDDEKYRR